MTCCTHKSTFLYKPRKPQKTVLHEAVRGEFTKWCNKNEYEEHYPYHSQKGI